VDGSWSLPINKIDSLVGEISMSSGPEVLLWLSARDMRRQIKKLICRVSDNNNQFEKFINIKSGPSPDFIGIQSNPR